MLKISLYLQVAFIILCLLSCFLLVLIINNTNNSYNFSSSFLKQEQERQQDTLEDDRKQEQKSKLLPTDSLLNKSSYYFKPNKVFSNKFIDQSSAKFIKNPKYKKKLLHLNKDLVYLLEPSRAGANKPEVECLLSSSSSSNGPKGPRTLIIFINSKWNNFDRRKNLRETWLNKWNIKNSSLCGAAGDDKIKRIKWFFALGLSKKQYLTNRIDSKVIEESTLNGDILVINLHERYRDMSTKHLSIYKWLLNEYVGGGDYFEKEEVDEIMVLKSDDDNKVNLNQLHRENINVIFEHEQRQQELDSRSNWLMCALFPEGRKTIRDSNKSKWSLTFEEYPFDTLPAYCSGLAYLMPLILIKRLYVVAHLIQCIDCSSDNKLILSSEQPLWIDDLYITGILRSSLLNKVNILNAIETYCFTKEQTSLKYHTMIKNNECTYLDLEMFTVP